MYSWIRESLVRVSSSLKGPVAWDSWNSTIPPGARFLNRSLEPGLGSTEWTSDLLVDLLEQPRPIANRTDEIPAVDVIKLVLENPLVLKVVDLESDIRGHPIRLFIQTIISINITPTRSSC